MSELTENGTWSQFSGATLADIYSRLRREQLEMALGLDPNEPLRARLALAVLTAAELGSADPISLETTARALLRVNFNGSPPAS